ncbi:uncharacterized protein EV420DRAFT_1478300 [Desarmillaria tabescens]|uniref:WD40 repeat-like protein n=1 Tax=Armillaria tabescens TaxID=1929756 RepID=A0AA39TQI5_ARMTA|nr:uncharacterized protein EV420DRAFT_1478300 [Desarmillaria tabescens]KAK0460529.1 hypothetical protein EV420DRAFT_1478300 [Desarmillaria tabescens]
MPTNYHLQQTLQSSHAAVFCLAITEKGNFLASGGSWGDTTAMIWIRREDDSDEVLMYGTLNGYMACWKQAKNTTDFKELYVLRMVHRVDGNMQLHGIFLVTINSFDPKAIHFHVNGNSRDVVVFGCHNGKIYFLRGADGNIMESIDTGGMICPRGNTAMDCEKDVFCLDDPAQGVALYRLSDGVRVKTFPIEATKVPRPRQVAFAKNCRVIVSGSDHSIVYVFERRDSNVHQLDTGMEDHIQTVTAANIDGISTVIAAHSRDIGKPSRIFIWMNSECPGICSNFAPKVKTHPIFWGIQHVQKQVEGEKRIDTVLQHRGDWDLVPVIVKA